MTRVDNIKRMLSELPWFNFSQPPDKERVEAQKRLKRYQLTDVDTTWLCQDKETRNICRRCGRRFKTGGRYDPYIYPGSKDYVVNLLCRPCSIIRDRDIERLDFEEVQRHYRSFKASERKIDKRMRQFNGKKYPPIPCRQFTPELKALARCIQHQQCAVCRTEFSKLSSKEIHADHCHRTGVPRGILCRDCNLAAGRVRDDPARCRALADYLENFPLELL